MNYSIINVSETIKKVLFQNEIIGELHKSDVTEGWYVQPSWTGYTGYFRSFERACKELLFKYCEEKSAFVVEC